MTRLDDIDMHQDFDTKELMKRVGQTYLSFDTYFDFGHMETIHDPDTAKARVTNTSFTTHFKRPNLLRFRWSDDRRGAEAISVIWFDGRSGHAKYTFQPDVEKIKPLDLLVAGATGVSGGTAHNITSLLIDEVGGRKLTDFSKLSYVETDTEGGEQCYRLRHIITAERERKTDIWISVNRLVVRRILEDYVIVPGQTERHLKAERFKSFQNFMSWFQHGSDKPLMRVEDMVIHRNTYYDEVRIDSEIPIEAFSELGTAD